MFTPLLTYLRTSEPLREPPETKALVARSRALRKAEKAAKRAAEKVAKAQRNARFRSGVVRRHGGDGGLEGAVRYEDHLPAYERVEGRGERVRGSMDAVFEFALEAGEGLPGYEEEGLPAYEEVWVR